MFKKLLQTASLLGAVTAQSKEEGPAILIPQATAGNVASAGQMGEILYTDPSGTALVWYIGFQTRSNGGQLPKYSWIQNYAQWEDPDAPGTYASVTCNVGFDPSLSVSAKAIVGSFYGQSISWDDVKTGTWDSFGTPQQVVPPEFDWQLVSEQDPSYADSYATVNTPEGSSQNCVVWVPSLTKGANGRPQSQELADQYWQWKAKDPQITMTHSGFRLYNRGFDPNPTLGAEGGSVTYGMHDWGNKLTKWVPPVEPAGPTGGESGGSSSGGSSSGGSSSEGGSGTTGGESGGSSSGGMTDDGKTDDKPMVKDEEEGGMMMIIIIIVVVAVVLILVVVIIFCVVRSKNNQKTPVQLKEGGEAEMTEITEI